VSSSLYRFENLDTTPHRGAQHKPKEFVFYPEKSVF
jgi:hypothetical protein